ncbi:alpha/beta fold hydrolase [Aquimarina sediminis]|uniref:alpha/beta fold hydrolase n=1 Tax=Aquimarina sediminis TaxID=2070536 RepID=UPI000CA0721F|nr:alpha/beta hydrolase [Aquimarina sediminis]
MNKLKSITAGDLCIAYESNENINGIPVILLHGFPYDVRAYDDVSKLLSNENYWIIVPYLRGFGPTRFLSKDTIRSGQQAALAYDLIALMDTLSIKKALIAGYDWGGRVACIVSAIFPNRVIGLLSASGYCIQNIAKSIEPLHPDIEKLYWYQYYFHNERGRLGLSKYRKELCEILWRNWSPTWKFDHSTYEETAISFNNPDFVEIVIHSYRHRYGLVKGDPKFEKMEQNLATQPKIKIPAIILEADADGVVPFSETDNEAFFFTGDYERLIIKGIGHNLPQEAPEEFAKAIILLMQKVKPILADL